MEEILLTSRQLMLAPDELAYELGLIKTPEQIAANKIIIYVAGTVIGCVVIAVVVHNIHLSLQKRQKLLRN